MLLLLYLDLAASSSVWTCHHLNVIFYNHVHINFMRFYLFLKWAAINFFIVYCYLGQ